MTDNEVVEGEVICGVKAAACVCGLEPDHAEEVHTCANELCGGQWTGSWDGVSEDGDFTPVRLPMEATLGRLRP